MRPTVRPSSIRRLGEPVIPECLREGDVVLLRNDVSPLTLAPSDRRGRIVRSRDDTLAVAFDLGGSADLASRWLRSTYTFRIIAERNPNRKATMSTPGFHNVNASQIESGDEVIATKGDASIRGTAVTSRSGSCYLTLPGVTGLDITLNVGRLTDRGYTLQRRRISPTEPGAYTDRTGRVWLRSTSIHSAKPWTAWDGLAHTDEVAASYAPFKKVG